MITLLLDWSKVIIQPIKDGNGERTLKLGPIVTISFHPWDSNAKNKTHQIPHNKAHPFHACLARKLCGQPTPGLSGTQWLEDLFCGKNPPFPFLILNFASREMTLPAFVEPSQQNEPPIPGLSQWSKPHEDPSTHGPEPEMASTKSMEEPFG
ncbi:hypothetical protein O181_052905 [Austropuccinia psidii MF-1]|uniref:Uncharacterized protein n=1 Tax=Austropuccinia psidii MF-1 TaxID=1389203 RepID=A0A9Q3HT31_9BASI|nr:hypothetical protein [Austropuccinia psidii MF-1]